MIKSLNHWESLSGRVLSQCWHRRTQWAEGAQPKPEWWCLATWWTRQWRWARSSCTWWRFPRSRSHFGSPCIETPVVPFAPPHPTASSSGTTGKAPLKGYQRPIERDKAWPQSNCRSSVRVSSIAVASHPPHATLHPRTDIWNWRTWRTQSRGAPGTRLWSRWKLTCHTLQGAEGGTVCRGTRIRRRERQWGEGEEPESAISGGKDGVERRILDWSKAGFQRSKRGNSRLKWTEWK